MGGGKDGCEVYRVRVWPPMPSAPPIRQPRAKITAFSFFKQYQSITVDE
jgi:hypothetical protein